MVDRSKRDHNRQLETIGWGLFLVFAGCLWLIPSSQVPSGAWLIGVGVIMLGLNLARRLNGIPASSFTLLLGTLALVLGATNLTGFEVPVFPLLLILVGTHILFGIATTRRS